MGTGLIPPVSRQGDLPSGTCYRRARALGMQEVGGGGELPHLHFHPGGERSHIPQKLQGKIRYNKSIAPKVAEVSLQGVFLSLFLVRGRWSPRKAHPVASVALRRVPTSLHRSPKSAEIHSLFFQEYMGLLGRWLNRKGHHMHPPVLRGTDLRVPHFQAPPEIALVIPTVLHGPSWPKF